MKISLDKYFQVFILIVSIVLRLYHLTKGDMMAAIKSMAAIAAKWGRVTPGRSADYEEGVRSPRKDWATAAANASGAWEEGVTQAASEGRFASGVREAGSEKWQRKAVEVGAQRWGPGVRAAQDDYASGFGKFRDVIERTPLPPRYPKGDPRNIERVRAIAEALHNAKMS